MACAARACAFELPERIGPYPVHRMIGAGGMGSVYAGQQHCPAREVAIKVIKDGLFADDVLRKKFLREREIAGSFEHPNIIRVYDAGEDEDGQLYYVMELAERGTLREFLRTQALSIRDAVRLVIEVSFAVEYAHQHGVRHRDLKPDNVLIGADRRPRVTDFGVALQLARDSDPPAGPDQRTLVGSYPYMAPEQAGYRAPSQLSAASDPGPQADVYSLGAIMYELVQGTPPHPVHTREALFAAFESGPPAPLRIRGYGVDYDLEAVIMKALDRDPQQRYPSPAAFAEDLRRTLARRPSIARPSSLRGKLVSTLSHHAAWFSILLTALAICFSTFASLEERELTNATQQTQRAAGAIALIFAHAASVTRQLAVDPMTPATLARAPGEGRDEAWLARIAAKNALINSAFLLTREGAAVAHFPPEPESYYRRRFEDRPYFQGVILATPQGQDLDVVVSPLFRSRASDGLVKLAFAAPVYDAQQRRVGVAVITVALEKLLHEIDPTLKLIVPCGPELVGKQATRVQLVRVDPAAQGEPRLVPIDKGTSRKIKAEVSNTQYQVVADTERWAAIARRDGLLLGMLALLCLCALALLLLRRANDRRSTL